MPSPLRWRGRLAALALSLPALATQLEAQVSWELMDVLRPTYGRAMTFDGARGRLVAFGGGLPDSYSDDTWEFGVGSWMRRSIAGPTPRQGAQMAFDAQRNRVVLVGGRYARRRGDVITGYPAPDDAWEFDGTSWTRIPSPLFEGRLVAFAAGNGVALLGTGQGAIWDGVAWTPSVGLPPYTVAAQWLDVHEDRARGRLVLIATDGTVGETWEYDGVAWSLAVPPPPTAALLTAGNGGVVAIDAARTTTWRYDGVSWQALGAVPPAVEAVGLASDTAADQAVLLGFDTSVWRLVGSSWTRQAPPQAPLGSYNANLASDPTREEVVVFTSVSPPLAAPETWIWNGANWRLVAGGPSPSSRSGHGMAYDGAGGIVLFGGTSAGPVADTWVWNGTAWTQLVPPNSPPFGGEAGMAYDPVRDRVVMVKRGAVQGGPLETWEWDRTTWTQVFPAQSPPDSASLIAVFDPSLGQIVLQGTDSTASTFAFDGQNWSAPSLGSVGLPQGMAFDQARERLVQQGRVVRTGGFGGSAIYRATYDFDPGAGWIERIAAGAPAANYGSYLGGRLAYDHAAERVIMLDQSYGMWRLEVPFPATATTAPAGCAGSAGVPRLGTERDRRPWIGDVLGVALSGAAPNAPFWLVLGDPASGCPVGLPFDLGPLGAPGCLVAVCGSPLGVGTANVAGEASVAVPVPVLPSLLGGSFDLQALLLDPQANRLGVTVSDLLTLVVGAR